MSINTVAMRNTKVAILRWFWKRDKQEELADLATTCSKLTIETLEQGVEYVQR